MDYGKLTATKHANGEDWWILVPKFESNLYYRLMLTSNGLVVDSSQSIGTKVLSGVGQAVFSPDGSRYARINMVGGIEGGSLDVYNFDRCTGLLSEHKSLFYDTITSSMGLAISPNSRFLFVSLRNYIVQYDLNDNNIFSTGDTVAIYDGYTSPAPTRFSFAQNGPDGKIYLCTTGSTNVLHVINQPNLSGNSCEVIQHGVTLPTLNKFSIPNFPNYRLDPLDISCDSIITNNDFIENIDNLITLFPNPTSKYVNILFENEVKENLEFRLSNSLGQVILNKKLYNQNEQKIEFVDFDDGVYYFSIHSTDRIVKNGKLVILNR